MTDIPGATSSTYTLVTADLGATITVEVTATNASGSAGATSTGVGPITAASLSPPLDGLSGVTGAWSASRKMLTAYGGSFQDNISGDAQTWYDQSGNSRDFGAGSSARPTISTGGPNSRACLDFDGTVDYMTATTLSNFITTTDGYFIATFITDRTSSNAANIYDNDPVFTDTLGNTGIHIKAGSVYGYQWEGGADITAGEAISTGTIHVVEWWHTGGNLSFRLNGGTTRTVASGNSSVSGGLQIGKCLTGAPGRLDGKLFEMAAFNAVPTSGDRNTLAANLMTWYGATGTSAEATAFLARTSGLDATHTSAYTALIDGLVADGVWAKLDVLYVHATQDATTANLNLVSSSYTAIPTGSPTFTADRGYTGAASGPKYVRTTFNPSTASSPKFVLASAHVSAWNLVTSGGEMIIGSSASGFNIGIYPKIYDGRAYFYANSGSDTNVVVADSLGHYIANRSGTNAQTAYKNGVSVATNTDLAVGFANLEMLVCGKNTGGGPTSSDCQIATASIGSSLNSTEATAFYNRLRTYMTAVGVP